MLKTLQAKLKNKKGFTLVELLIVIAVLGIISAIAVPRFTGVLGGVKNKADVSAATLWAKEIEAEFMVEGWTIPTEATGYAIANGATQDFGGTVPKSQVDTTKYLTAVITVSGGNYTLKVYFDSADADNLLYTKELTPPIQ